MMATEKITVTDVRNSIDPNIEVHPFVSKFARPSANLVTPFFHNRGWTANRMTNTRTWIAIVGVALLISPIPLLWQISVAIYYVGTVLDCVDGNLARVQDKATYYGKFADGVADIIYPSLSAFFLGIGSWLYFDEPALIILGAAIAIADICNQMVRNRLSFFREWMVNLSGELTAEEQDKAAMPRAIQAKLVLFVVNGYFLAILALLFPDAKWAVIGFYTISTLSQLIPNLLWIVSTMMESGAILNRGRKSKSARVQTPEP